MKIYVDLVLFINFSFDLLLLLCVSIVLRRNAKFSKLLIASFVGSLSILFLFININSFCMFLLKVVISIFMVLIAFGYRNIKFFLKNMLFLYTTSILFGGFLYYLSVTFSYKNTGLVFYFDGLSINYIFLIIFSPIILFIYVKQAHSLKVFYSNCYKVELIINDKSYFANGFMDTGNNAVDPFFFKPIIFVNFNIDCKKKYLVPCNGVNGRYVIDCYRGKLKLNNKVYDVMVGYSKDVKYDGVECLLNNRLEVYD